MYCQHCKTRKNLHINSRTKKGTIQYMCRKCTTERAKKYRSTPRGKKIVYAAVYKSTLKHMDKQKARMKLNYRVKVGHIIKPKVCSICHKKKKVEGHHEDYSKPLVVVWLCRQCHFDIEK